MHNKIVIAYQDSGNANFGTAIVGTVSGTSISFGTAVVFESANSTYISATFDSLNNKIVIAYRDVGNSGYGTVIAGTVSDTSISFETSVVFESASSNYISATFDSLNNKIVIAYQDSGNANFGTAIVGTVSGTSISFGTAVVFESANSTYISATFDSLNNKIVIAYRDVGNSGYGTVIAGTVSDTSISFETSVVFESASSNYISATFDSLNNKIVIAYLDEGNSGYGTAIVFQPQNTTAINNTIGIANSTVVDTASVNIDILAGINTSQIGLTIGDTYYVDADGTITNIDSGLGVIGKALSATELLITKGI